MAPTLIGCAGWNIPKQADRRFPTVGTHLERYACRLPAVEINSSFYRPHRQTTYAKWADSVPTTFRFAVKLPKAITHISRLVDAKYLLDSFLTEVAGLGTRLGVLLVQLPPSLHFERQIVNQFFVELRTRHDGAVVCEPRHPTWFEPEAEALMSEMRVARVAADPALVPAAARCGGWKGVGYFRLHGSPKRYYSEYTEDFLDGFSVELAETIKHSAEVWCVFDNTAVGFAATNALDLLQLMRENNAPNAPLV